MKKLFILLMLSLTFGVSAQSYNTWSVEGGLGAHWVADQSAVATDHFNHYNLTVRKSFSPLFGLGLYGGHDNLSLRSKEGVYAETDYTRLTLEGVIHVSRALQIDNQVFNLLAHGGVGAARIAEDRDFVSFGDRLASTLGKPAHTDRSQTILAVSGGITGLFKVNDNLAAKLDWTTTVNANQDNTLDYRYKVANAQVNSIVNNLSVGVVFYLGKNKGHTDWNKKAEVIRTVYVDRTVTKEISNVTNVTNSCDCSIYENVYFDNDKDVIKIQGLNAIEKVAEYLKQNQGTKVVITGSASPTTATSYEYDLDLSKRRVSAVESNLISLGVTMDRVIVKYVGKDESRKDTHEFARRVSLQIK